MAYENIGTPTGNNLYITIPLRGTDNWDEKLKDGFFQRVVDHDHTPGKGAAIQEAALDNALQTKVAAIATNTSEIAQNALDISQNAAAILANATNINSNDTDIAALDTRLTTAESNITSNDTDIAALDTRLTTAENASLTTPDVISIFQSRSLQELSNVQTGIPNNGDTLIYNSSTNEWESVVPSTGGSGNIEMQVADSLNITSTSANTEYEVISPAPDYNPNSLIVNNNQFEAPSNGIYIVNVSCLFSGGATTGSSIYVYKNSNLVKFATKSGPRHLSTGDKVLSLVAGDLINITISTSDGSSHSIQTDYTIKKIS